MTSPFSLVYLLQFWTDSLKQVKKAIITKIISLESRSIVPINIIFVNLQQFLLLK